MSLNMEWNSHLTAIQGTLMSIEKVTGQFFVIKYKGGNEQKISKIVSAIEQYLTSKNFIKNKVSNTEYTIELQSIVQFMFLNTEFECNTLLDIKELSHLKHVTPALSKCVLANIVVDLDLVLYYSKLVALLPIQAHLELLPELITCIKHSQPENAVEHVYILINEIIQTLCSLQDQEAIDKLLTISSEMLKNMSSVKEDWLAGRKLKQINQHMGITLMYMLRLLRKCPIHTTNLGKLVEDLIRIAMTLMQAVTVTAYCVWAEVTYEEQPLQLVIAGEAYQVIEHLHKFKPGIELVEMLGSIAKKPRTFIEIVNEADISTLINKINNCDSDQRHWFNAFINKNPLQNDETIHCLRQWSHLCNKDDVTIILNCSVPYHTPVIKETVLKCADNLTIVDLAAVSMRYLVEKNTNNLDTGTINEHLKVLLNKLEVTTETDNYFIKQIHLMLLQNPKQVMICLFEKCTVNVGFIPCVRPTFRSIIDIVKVNDIWKTALLEVWSKEQPNFQNSQCYVKLLNELHDLLYFKESMLICDILIPLLHQSTVNDSKSTLLNMLHVFNMIDIQYKLQDNTVPILGVLLNIMETNRCEILSFSSVCQQIVHQCVCILLKYRSNSNLDELKQSSFKDFVDDLKIINNLNKFYIENLGNPSKNNFLSSIYPTYNVNDIASLLEILLPSCVEQEWIYIVKELEIKFGYESTCLLLTNVLIQLCRFVDSHNSDQAKNCLKYCLEVYGIIIKDVFRQRHTNLQDEIFLTKNVVKLLPCISQDVRHTNGLGLINLLTTESLQALKDDKAFIFLLVSIKDAMVSEMVVKRMLS